MFHSKNQTKQTMFSDATECFAVTTWPIRLTQIELVSRILHTLDRKLHSVVSRLNMNFSHATTNGNKY